MAKWIVRSITKELNQTLLKLQREISQALGYKDIKIRDACKVLVEKNKRYPISLAEIKIILGGE